jgi:hypothetical protein
MNWSAIGAAAELLSALGVLVTLLYLARQIRLNTKEVRDSAVQAIQEQNIAFLDSDLHTDIGFIYDRTFAGETTTPSEKAKLRIWFVRNLKLYELVYLQHRMARIDDDIFRTYETRLRREMESTLATEHWPRARALFVPDFVDHVDKISGSGHTP